MADTANRVLSLKEVLALPDGARVWVEASDQSEYSSAAHYRGTTRMGEPALKDGDGGYWPITPEWINSEYRVWSLPQPPTQEELEKNPWEVQDDG